MVVIWVLWAIELCRQKWNCILLFLGWVGGWGGKAKLKREFVAIFKLGLGQSFSTWQPWGGGCAKRKKERRGISHARWVMSNYLAFPRLSFVQFSCKITRSVAMIIGAATSLHHQKTIILLPSFLHPPHHKPVQGFSTLSLRRRLSIRLQRDPAR